MKILQRYILKEVLVPTLMALATLTFVLLMQMVYTSADDMAGGLTLGLIFRFIGYVLPSLLMLTVPMAVLTGVLLGIGRLTVDSEVKSMQTHGVQMLSVFGPVFVLGLVAMVFELFNTLHLAPTMFAKSLDLRDEVSFRLINSLEPQKFEDRFSTEGADMVIYFDRRDPETGALKNVYLTAQGAPKGLLDAEEETGEGQKKKTDTPEVPKVPELPQALEGTLERGAAGTATINATATPALLAVPPDVRYKRFPPGKAQTIELPQSDAPVSTPSLTLEAWFRTSAVGEAMSMVSLWNEGKPHDWVWMGLDTDGRLVVHYQVGETHGRVASRLDGLNDGRWHYGAAMRETTGRWQLAIDGHDTADPTRGPALASPRHLGIGLPVPDTKEASNWQGDLGMVRASSKERNLRELTKNWNGGAGLELVADTGSLAVWVPDAMPGTEAAAAQLEALGEDDEEGEGPLKTVFLASEGRIEAARDMSFAVLRLTSGTIHVSRGRTDPRYTLIEFAHMSQDFQLASDEKESNHKKGKRKREAMTAGEIRQELAERGRDSKRSREIFAELLQRISLSIGCLTFVLIGLPLAIYVRPSGKSIGIVIALILMAVYYGFLHYGVQMSRDGHLFGNVFIFLPNLLLTILGVLLLYRTCFR